MIHHFCIAVISAFLSRSLSLSLSLYTRFLIPHKYRGERE